MKDNGTLTAGAKEPLVATMVKPTLYRLRSIRGLMEGDKEMLNYHWAEAHELASCVNEVMTAGGYGAGLEHVIDLFSRFDCLNHFEEGRGRVTWVSELGYANRGDYPTEEQMTVKIYVPAAWARNIIALAKKGVALTYCETSLGRGEVTDGRSVIVDRYDYFAVNVYGMKHMIEVQGLLPQGEVKLGPIVGQAES